MINNILDNIINKKEENILLTGVVSSLSPLQVKLYPSDDAIKVKCVTSMLGLAVGSNVLLTRYYSKFIIIGVIGDPTDIETDITNIESDITDLTPSWTTWSPSLTWGTATPSSITGVYRYCKVGKLVHFAIDITSTDGNGATSLTISLPVNAQSGSNLHTMFSASQLVGSAWTSNLISFHNVPVGTNVIEFRNFATCTNAVTFYIFVSGFYESAT